MQRQTQHVTNHRYKVKGARGIQNHWGATIMTIISLPSTSLVAETTIGAASGVISSDSIMTMVIVALPVGRFSCKPVCYVPPGANERW